MNAELFEVPENFKSITVGTLFEVDKSEVLDWMVNDTATVYGGFSIRYHRSAPSPLINLKHL